MAKFTKPITIEAQDSQEAEKVQNAIKNMLTLFSNDEIIVMSNKVKSPVTRQVLRSYLK